MLRRALGQQAEARATRRPAAPGATRRPRRAEQSAARHNVAPPAPITRHAAPWDPQPPRRHGGARPVEVGAVPQTANEREKEEGVRWRGRRAQRAGPSPRPVPRARVCLRGGDEYQRARCWDSARAECDKGWRAT